MALQRDLNLSVPPRRIECFDNSHLQGTDMVSSMVVFVDGKPKKSEYRKFKAKEIEPLSRYYDASQDAEVIQNGVPHILPNTHNNISATIHNDDFAMMRQTIERRFKRAIEEKQSLPDLVIVDGGKGQLSSAYKVLAELGLEKKIAVIGLAKRLEEVFLPHNKYSIMLPKTSSSLKLIQQLRDEAHRFAITFNRELRSKRAVKSELLELKGIGKATAQKLIEHFGSVKGIKEATITDLTNILNPKQLEIIKKMK